MKKRILAIMLLSVMALAQFTGCKKDEPVVEEPVDTIVEEPVTEEPETPAEPVVINDALEPVNFAKTSLYGGEIFFSQGDLEFEMSPVEFMTHFEYGDKVLVKIGTISSTLATVERSVGEAKGDYVIVANPDESEHVQLYKMYDTSGVALDVLKEEDGDYHMKDGNAFPIQVTVYSDDVDTEDDLDVIQHFRDLRTNNRDDYPHLSDEEFANFRAVATTGIRENWLYRSSTPISDQLGRNEYGIAAAETAGVNTFINLCQEQDFAAAEAGYSGYYSDHTVVYSYVHSQHIDGYDQAIATGFRGIAQQQGPFLVHCIEGKDRTGFMIAVLEALMGASIDEISADYVKTYTNFYSIKDGQPIEFSPALKQSMADDMRFTLETSFEIEDVYSTDLQLAAENYLVGKCGLTTDEVEAIKANLSK